MGVRSDVVRRTLCTDDALAFPLQVLREDLPTLGKSDQASADTHWRAALQVRLPRRQSPFPNTLLIHHHAVFIPFCKAVPTQFRGPVALHIMIHRIVYYVYQPKIIGLGSLKIDT